MAYKIVETELAGQDLDSILSYIARSLANPSAAASFAGEVENCYASLENMPLMFGFCRDPRLRALGYHKAIIKNYIMVYKVEEAAKTVTILRFFYGRQDYEKLSRSFLYCHSLSFTRIFARPRCPQQAE